MQFPLLTLSWKSLMNRKVSVFLTILSLALSVMLFTGVEKIRQGARTGFENTISGTDLVVGARTGQLNLLLNTVFRIGEGTQGISFESYEVISALPQVVWSIPLSLGDSHRGYRVLGTTPAYFEHFRYGAKRPLAFAAGNGFVDETAVVLGADVAVALGYKVGDTIRISHGLVATSFAEHDTPFHVSGILKPTGTPVDATVHVTLAGLEIVHEEPGHGASDDHEPREDDDHAAHEEGDHEAHGSHGEHEGHDHGDDPAGEGSHVPGHEGHDHEPGKITAFFLGLSNPTIALPVQYQINNYEGEPLTAILPGVTLGQLWSMLGAVEKTLFAISAFVVLVGLLGMIIRILSSLNERRREMAILRAVGARPANIFGLLVTEAALSAFIGAILGLLMLYGGLQLAGIMLPDSSRIPALDAIVAQRPGQFDLAVVLGVTVLSAIMGLFPAWKASRDSLNDGLTIRV